MAARRRRPPEVELPTQAMVMHDLVNRFFGGSQQDLAKKIGRSQGFISKVLHGQQHLSVESCLRVALLTDADPLQLWRVHGHSEFAEGIRHLYGDAHRTPVVLHLSGDEREFKEQIWDKLSASDREFLRASLIR